MLKQIKKTFPPGYSPYLAVELSINLTHRLAVFLRTTAARFYQVQGFPYDNQHPMEASIPITVCEPRPSTIIRETGPLLTTDKHLQDPAFVAYDEEWAQTNSKLQVAFAGVMQEGNYPVSHTYNEVHVLLLSWDQQHDDLKVKEEVDDLETVFREIYHYDVQSSLLQRRDLKKAQSQINRIVAIWVDEKDAPNKLLIVYFAGHGGRGIKNGYLELRGNRNTEDLRQDLDRIIWNRTEANLEDTHADVLQIFDCCYAGNLEPTRGGGRVFEYLAATSANHTTKAPGPHSFTRALIWSLKDLAKSENAPCRFSTSELLNKITKDCKDFPSDQKPIMTRRYSHSNDTIILEPLGPDRIYVPPPDSQSHQDPWKQSVLVLKFVLDSRPSPQDIVDLGCDLNVISAKKVLRINRIIWGGLKSRQRDEGDHTAYLLHKTANAWLGPIRRRLSSAGEAQSPSPAALTGATLVERLENEIEEHVIEKVQENLFEQVHEEFQQQVKQGVQRQVHDELKQQVNGEIQQQVHAEIEQQIQELVLDEKNQDLKGPETEAEAELLRS